MLIDPKTQPTRFVGNLEAAAYIERTPADATCKGMFFTELLAAARKTGGREIQARLFAHSDGRYLRFRDYPLRDHMALSAAVAPLMYPDVSERESMRRLGWQASTAFQQTTVGRIVFSALGIDLDTVLAAGPRACEVSMSHGRAIAERIGPRHWRYRMHDFFGYLDTYYVGAIEGPILASGFQPDVTLEAETPSSGTMDIRWH